MNVLRLQRRMSHHSPAFTLETYGHLLDSRQHLQQPRFPCPGSVLGCNG
jgi:hypothetical protein